MKRWKWAPSEERDARRAALAKLGRTDFWHYDFCPDCGEPKKKVSARCRRCSFTQPRKRWSDDPRAGRMQAKNAYPIEGLCRRCELVPAKDGHHRDGDVFNNEPHNIFLVCRRCHMELEEKIVRRGLDEVVPIEEYVLLSEAS